MATKKSLSSAARVLGKEGGKEAARLKKGIHSPTYKAKRKAAPVRKVLKKATSKNR